MPNGYWDRILHVDLTARTTWTEALGEAFWRRNLGGRALIAHYLLSGVPVGAAAGITAPPSQKMAHWGRAAESCLTAAHSSMSQSRTGSSVLPDKR